MIGEIMREPLEEALARLRQDFSDVCFEVRLEFRAGTRSDLPVTSTSWSTYDWQVQVGNDRGKGDSFENAVADLREKRARKALIPGRADRIAAILREIPDYHDRNMAIDAAQCVLDKERREFWKNTSIIVGAVLLGSALAAARIYIALHPEIRWNP